MLSTPSSLVRWLLTVTVLSAVGVDGFANTYPIVAWADQPLQSLRTLTPTPKSSSSARHSSHQTTFSSNSASGSDLCSLSSILLVSAPGLHYSDLSLLPSSPAGVRARLTHHRESSLTHAYVPMSKGALTTPERLARDFVQHCGAVIEFDSQKNFWGGEQGKTVQVRVIEGLDEWELLSPKARAGRHEVVQQIDEAVQEHVHSLPGPYLVVITSLPTASTDALLSIKALPKRHVKRQGETFTDTDSTANESEAEAEAIEAIIELEEAIDAETSAATGDGTSTTISVDDPVDLMGSSIDPEIKDTLTESELLYDSDLGIHTPWSSAQAAFAPNQTSIFAVEPNSGLLHRYVFFTPALVLSIIISTLILLPLLIFTTQALTTVQTVHGLEHKMTGSVGIDASKGGS